MILPNLLGNINFAHRAELRVVEEPFRTTIIMESMETRKLHANVPIVEFVLTDSAEPAKTALDMLEAKIYTIS